MIEIKNVKIFNCDISKPYHWSKLGKLKEIMEDNCLKFPIGANLGGAYLRSANLGGAYLGGANLGGANLEDANLGGAYLGDANLGDANLGGAYLVGAYLGDANNKRIIIKEVMTVFNLGSRNDATIIYNTDNGIYLKCGCFFGNEKEFLQILKETHGSNCYAKEYKQMLKLAHQRFSRKEEE